MVDVKRAYFNAKTDPEKPTAVELPEEEEGHGTHVGLLLRHLYGTRPAADGWQEEYSTTLVEGLGFKQGLSSPCVFHQPERGLSCSVHGDDFSTTGPKRHLDWFEEEIAKRYEVTIAPRLGPGSGDAKEGRVLNRIVRWTGNGLELEADPRQAEKLIEECGLAGGNSVCTPSLRETPAQITDDKPLSPELKTAFRASAARANYLAADRVDCQYAAKEICRWMATPTQRSWEALKRLARFIVGLPRLVYRFPWQDVDKVDVYSDTDWAGCPRTRKSTSGGCVMLGEHVIKHWASTQPSVSLSSGEAEFYGVVKGAGMGLGYQSLLRDLGHDMPLRLWTDSSAAIGICARQGLGKLRHLDTHTLWVQQAVRSGRVDLRKVDGEVNPADVFTKHSASRDKLAQLVNLFGCQYREGRAEAAPQLKGGVGTKTTIGEAIGTYAVDPELYMPHLRFSGEDLDRHHPPMTVDAGLSDMARDIVQTDSIFDHGKRLAAEIAENAAVHGRRRKVQMAN